MQKFKIDLFVDILEKNYRDWNAPIVTFIANRRATPFEVLVSTILSLRTKDKTTSKAAARLFKSARTPLEIFNLDEKKIAGLIYPVGFYRIKAKRLREISRILIEKYNMVVPDNIEQLLELPGVGRKTANLVLIEGYKKDAICVDVHVHRISNRIGYVNTNVPEKTEFALRKKLPQKYWTKYNELLVPFGQTVCKPVSPLCSSCPVSHMCPRLGVKKYR
ncbi:MAG TPA: endonuclease III [Desulfobacteraceae bacterium]|nr:endonuclease III [Desulfobacteraceae bacterium]